MNTRRSRRHPALAPRPRKGRLMVKTWNIAIPELTGREKRRAYLYLPTMYRDQPRRPLSVLYMFDGHNVFFDSHATHGKSWAFPNTSTSSTCPSSWPRGMQSSSRQRPPLRIFALRLLRSRIRLRHRPGRHHHGMAREHVQALHRPALAHHSLARADLHCRQLQWAVS